MKKIASANSKIISWSFFLALTLLVPATSFGQTTEDIAAHPAVKDEHTAVAIADSVAPTAKAKLPLESCKVKNFGKVTDFYYRGAQPRAEQYAQLAGIGVKTIVDLRNDPEIYAKSEAEAAGLTYINLPMSDTEYPSQETVKQFIEMVKGQSAFPIYVHCHGGRHRTGVMTAVYRMTFENWDIKKAYDEMKDYDFYTRWGHGKMKDFVYDYWKELQASGKNTTQTPVVTAGAR